MSAIARLRELFLLTQVAEEARQRPAARREAVGQALGLGRQRADAAEALWSNGHAAEGLRLAVDALERTLEAAERLRDEVRPNQVAARERALVADGEGLDASSGAAADAPAVPEAASDALAQSEDATIDAAPPEDAALDAAPPEDAATDARAVPAADAPTEAAATDLPSASGAWAAVLGARGMSGERVESLSRVLQLGRQPLPELDAAVSATHAELYKELFRARADADRALTPTTYSPTQVRWRVAQRIATSSLALLLAVVLAYFAIRTPRTVTASASAHFRNDPQFGPDRVFDEDPNTEWLLNDGQTGWLEARLSPPRDMRQLRILNGHNRQYNDRAVKEYALELYDAAGTKVFETEGEFDFSPSPEWVSHDLSATQVERIRFTVKSFHRSGAALAEIAWDER
ncbi:MAG: hypothetical protein KF901_12060 [Myxococcales bacterium]|nr:hypothetical protein [Myxococcales bacterium]